MKYTTEPRRRITPRTGFSAALLQESESAVEEDQGVEKVECDDRYDKEGKTDSIKYFAHPQVIT